MKGGEPKIREANARDAAGIARVQVESWHTTFRGRLPDDYLAGITFAKRLPPWEKELTETPRGESVFVAETEGGEIVGFASCGPERDGDADFDCELYAIYILEAFQRRGLGRRLSLAVAERLSDSGFRALLIWALEVNDAGRRFYEKFGGRMVRSRVIVREAQALPTVGYGWPSVREFRGRLRGV